MILSIRSPPNGGRSEVGSQMIERAAEHQPHVNIKVNRIHVVMPSDDSTGAAVKTAAIAQGVEIKQDFVLSVLAEDGKWDIVADNDPLELHDGEQFSAVAPEEHS